MLAVDDQVKSEDTDNHPDKERQGNLVQEPHGGFICCKGDGKDRKKAPDNSGTDQSDTDVADPAEVF
jgi:hypothetical protein